MCESCNICRYISVLDGMEIFFLELLVSARVNVFFWGCDAQLWGNIQDVYSFFLAQTFRNALLLTQKPSSKINAYLNKTFRIISGPEPILSHSLYVCLPSFFFFFFFGLLYFVFVLHYFSSPFLSNKLFHYLRINSKTNSLTSERGAVRFGCNLDSRTSVYFP